MVMAKNYLIFSPRVLVPKSLHIFSVKMSHSNEYMAGFISVTHVYSVKD